MNTVRSDTFTSSFKPTSPLTGRIREVAWQISSANSNLRDGFQNQGEIKRWEVEEYQLGIRNPIGNDKTKGRKPKRAHASQSTITTKTRDTKIGRPRKNWDTKTWQTKLGDQNWETKAKLGQKNWETIACKPLFF